MVNAVEILDRVPPTLNAKNIKNIPPSVRAILDELMSDSFSVKRKFNHCAHRTSRCLGKKLRTYGRGKKIFTKRIAKEITALVH